MLRMKGLDIFEFPWLAVTERKAYAKFYENHSNIVFKHVSLQLRTIQFIVKPLNTNFTSRVQLYIMKGFKGGNHSFD